jgi:hypothetical protein
MFSAQGLDSQISVDSAHEFRFSARVMSGVFGASARPAILGKRAN